jgi:hypothetical protein
MSKGDYEVGYGKPPEATRFKKGASGNPKGRPKGTRNLSTDIREVLGAKVSVMENGKPRRVSTQLATLMRLREKALKGDIRSMERLLDLAHSIGAEDQARAEERGLSGVEADILDRFVDARRHNASEDYTTDHGGSDANDTRP